MLEEYRKIFFFGDSITEGQYVGAPHRWFDIVSQRYQHNGEKDFFLGADSGDTVVMAMARFPRQVQQISPDWLFIQFGLNDSNRWQTDKGHPRISTPLYKAALQEFINRAVVFGVKKITLMDAHQVTKEIEGHGPLNTLVSTYNHAMKEISDKTGSDLLSLNETSKDWDLHTALLPDGVHLSKKGHQHVADALIDYMENA